MKNKIGISIKVIVLLLLFGASIWLLGNDSVVFLKWWLAVLLLGIGYFPITQKLFDGFLDKGWMLSKVFGVAGAGFLVWLFANCKIPVFTRTGCLAFSVLSCLGIWGIWWLTAGKKQRKMTPVFNKQMINSALDGEIVFVAIFLMWTYFAGFRPAAYGTEKFMDYGFMMTMMRCDTLPAKDLWYAGANLNYYYGGQYFAVFLTKLTGTQVAQTYNLMRTLVAGFAFALPFGLVCQMVLDRYGKPGKTRQKIAVFGGVLAGAGVSLAGNMHYVVIGKLLPWVRKILQLPESDYTYWFPNSTRYIGYYPAESDKTIHEYPSYSIVLGDLHAHVVNMMFVLALICLMYAMVQKYKRIKKEEITFELQNWKTLVKNILLEPYVLVFGFFIGLFHWTNYWDFIIYFVMGEMTVIYCNYLRCSVDVDWKIACKRTAGVSIIHAIWVFFLGTLFALPFTLQFETMVSGVALAQNHSRPYQWWLIWGLQVGVTVLFFWCVWKEYRQKRKSVHRTDAFGVILGISALGLIVIPELVYVRDIYEKEYARSNTMFKLTYQAFIMFGILMAFAFVRLWMRKSHWCRKVLTTVGFACFLGCCFYTATAVYSWFGQVWDKEQYKGLDATAFLETSFSEDAAAIRWLNENVEGSPVVLESQGDSYSDHERVSAMTGLPTVLGWYVHEWLWRGGIEELNNRTANVETIYTSTDVDLVESLLDEYEVEYIFVGKMERQKYTNLNESLLCSLGEVVFVDEVSSTYIIKVN